MFKLLTQAQRFKYKFAIDRKRFVLNSIKKHQSTKILEIGVFNGDFASRMIVQAISTSPNKLIEYTGVDLFESNMTTDLYNKEISLWPLKLDAVKIKLQKFPHIKVELLSGYSKDVLPKLVGSRKFNLILIDGGHSYETVKSDYESSLQLIDDDGIIIFDDYCNPKGVSAGGFGIRQVVNEIDKDKFSVKISLNYDLFWKTYGLLVLKMVSVKRHEKRIK